MKKKGLKILAATMALLFATPLTGIAAKKNTFGKPFTPTAILNFRSLQSEKLAAPKAGGLTLAENGESAYVIVYPENAGERLLSAMDFFRRTFETISGASLPVHTDAEPASEHEIVIGLTTRTPEVVKNVDLGTDGYIVKTQDSRLIIAGAEDAGTINGVYGFLEDTLGCMWLAQDADFIPTSSTVCIAPEDKTKKPAMQWRNIYSYEVTQNGWFEKLRLNGLEYADDRSGESKDGTNRYAQWGTWCHSYLSFVPVDKYYDEHPEYFALKNGKRVAHDDKNDLDTQLCLTNPDVYEIVRDEMKRRMDENPDKLYWDFSVMDSWSIKGCECDNCRRLDKAAGSGMGSLLPFINKLAREFPDRYISTLAYYHTLKAPVGITAEPNVVIKLCSMAGDQASSYAEGGTAGAKEFQKLVHDWQAVCSNITVWDYVVNFSNLLLPFPNFSVQQDNQRFYEENNVTGVFHQASREESDEFADLRAYLLSHLLWDGSALDVQELAGRYLSAFYGPAAEQLAEYMGLSSKKLYESQIDLGLFDNLTKHKKGYLSTEAIAQYRELFEKAETACAGEEPFLSRVKEAKIPILYAKVMEESTDMPGKEAAAAELFPLARGVGITRFSETGNLTDAFEKNFSSIQWEIKKRIQIIPIAAVAGSLAGAGIVCAVTAVVIKKVKKKKHAGQ